MLSGGLGIISTMLVALSAFLAPAANFSNHFHLILLERVLVVQSFQMMLLVCRVKVNCIIP